MPKVCPFLLIDTDFQDTWTPPKCACLGEECAWWVHTREITGCALPVLAASRCDFALVRFLTLSEEEQLSATIKPPKKRGSNG